MGDVTPMKPTADKLSPAEREFVSSSGQTLMEVRSLALEASYEFYDSNESLQLRTLVSDVYHFLLTGRFPEDSSD